MAQRKLFWLDCDPGHDDAIAILLALYEPSIELLGVSTVHGNAALKNTTINAARCLVAFGGPQHTAIKVHPGAAKPLIGKSVASTDIHGSDGLGGVEGLPAVDDPRVENLIVPMMDMTNLYPAISGLCVAAMNALNSGTKLNIGITGSFTNIAIFLLTYPDLARASIQQIICMGGSVGFGNITASAEFNIWIDPEAVQIVLEFGLPVVMIPLNVTHQMLIHRDAMQHLLNPTSQPLSTSAPLEKATTPLRHTLATLFTFFASTYRDVFGFEDGPPIHDMLVVAYLADPSLFGTKLCRVDAERGGHVSKGHLAVSPYPKAGIVQNCEVTLSVDVPAILRKLFIAIAQADINSPLNQGVTIPSELRIPDAAVRAGVTSGLWLP